jgi:hypothetical protein
MRRDERDLLEVLKFELEFLQQGGYGRSPRTPWKPQYLFEDSLTCMNHDSKESPGPCSDCVLMYLVPRERHAEKVPCRHIPFNGSGETLDSLYRDSNQQQIEETVEDWLRTTIQRLEEERTAARRCGCDPLARGDYATKAIALFHEQHPKCANTTKCLTAFHWAGGGRLFRFRPDLASQEVNDSSTDLPRGVHGVRHYWLCERCSHLFTLVHEEGCGVLLRDEPELPAPETFEDSSAA